MGWTSPPPMRLPTPESMLRTAYITGKITLEQFEDAIGEAIEGVWTKTTPLVLPKPPVGPAAGVARPTGPDPTLENVFERGVPPRSRA